MDFTKFFRAPGKRLLDLFRGVWPWKVHGQTQHNDDTGAVVQTGFSDQSRRYNALFCLAVHEVQASNKEKELKLNTPYTPANVRIHGTMYRRVLSTAEDNPVRYLVVDPAQRQVVAATFKLDTKIMEQLESILVPGNEHMQCVRRLRQHARQAENVSLRLCDLIGTRANRKYQQS